MHRDHCWRMTTDEGLAALADVRRFAEAVADSAGLDDERAFDLKVAVSEACANAMEHARARDDAVEVCATEMPDRVVIEIADRGSFAGPDGARANGGAQRGLGLPLMIALMDEVTVRRVRGQGTVVTLTLRRGNSLPLAG